MSFQWAPGQPDALREKARVAAEALGREAIAGAKQPEDLVALGGKFYEVDGASWCDTPTDSWKLFEGIGYIRQG